MSKKLQVLEIIFNFFIYYNNWNRSRSLVTKQVTEKRVTCYILRLFAGADAEGCHCCQCSTPKWLTLISRVQFSFLKKLWTRFSNLTKIRCGRHCSKQDAYIGSVCNFQSMKTPVKLNNLLSKFFCCITWFVISLD